MMERKYHKYWNEGQCFTRAVMKQTIWNNSIKIQLRYKQGMEMHTCDLTTWEAEAQGL